MGEKRISYINIPSFSIEVESVKNPSLRTRPVAIAPLNSDRSKLWSLSDAARAEGLRKGMPVGMAKRFCRDLIVLPPNPDLYSSVNRRLHKVLMKWVPTFEFEREGKVFVDCGGMEGLYKSGENLAGRLKQLIKNDFHLSSSVGLAQNKLVAKVAAKNVTPVRELQTIQEGSERSFLAPLPQLVLPPAKELFERQKNQELTIFSDLNIQTVDDIAQIDFDLLQLVFGERAQLLHDMSHGVDPRLVLPAKERPAVFVDHHFDEESNALSEIEEKVFSLAREAFSQLRKLEKSCDTLTLSLRYSDFKFVQQTRRFKTYCSYFHESQSALKTLLRKLFYRRTNIRYLSLELTGFCQHQQLTLFEEQKKTLKLDHSLDAIKQKFASNIIQLGKKI